MYRNLSLLAVILMALVSSEGCGNKKVSTNTPATKQPTGETPTDAECEEFANEFVTAVSAGEADKATRMIDWDMLLDIAFSGVDVPAEVTEGATAAAKRTTARSFADKIIQTLDEGGSYEFLRVRKLGAYQRALFRFLGPTGSLNYHEFVLVKNKGAVRAADIYIYGAGEMSSQTLRRLYLMGIAESQPTLVDRLSGKAKQEAKHGADMIKMGALRRQGRFQQAVNVYHGLPQELRQEKTIMLVYVMAASELGDATYEAAIDKFRKVYADDPSVDMLSVDGFIIKKDYERALAACNRVNTSVGGDPYVHTLRASIYLEQNDIRRAKEEALEAVRKAPNLLNSHTALLGVLLAEKNHPETAKLLTAMMKKFPVKTEDLHSKPEFKEFLESPEYLKWRNAQK